MHMWLSVTVLSWGGVWDIKAKHLDSFTLTFVHTLHWLWLSQIATLSQIPPQMTPQLVKSPKHSWSAATSTPAWSGFSLHTGCWQLLGLSYWLSSPASPACSRLYTLCSSSSSSLHTRYAWDGTYSKFWIMEQFAIRIGSVLTEWRQVVWSFTLGVLISTRQIVGPR